MNEIELNSRLLELDGALFRLKAAKQYQGRRRLISRIVDRADDYDGFAQRKLKAIRRRLGH